MKYFSSPDLKSAEFLTGGMTSVKSALFGIGSFPSSVLTSAEKDPGYAILNKKCTERKNRADFTMLD